MDSDAIHATLPYPPTVNHYWRHAVRRGRVHVFVGAEGLAYRRRVQTILDGVPTFSGRLRVVVRVCPPDHRARDIDNLMKCLLDSLTKAGVWDDDSQVDELVIVRDKPTKGGLVKVVITERQVENLS